VIGDLEAVPMLERVFRPDLQRRGHGDILTAEPQMSVEQLLSRLADTL
jgi:hypothetical protein